MAVLPNIAAFWIGLLASALIYQVTAQGEHVDLQVPIARSHCATGMADSVTLSDIPCFFMHHQNMMVGIAVVHDMGC